MPTFALILVVSACTTTVKVGESSPPDDSAPPDSPTDSPTDSLTESVPGTDSVGDSGGVDSETVPDPVYEHVPVFLFDVSGSITDGEKTAGTLTVVREHDGTLTDLDDAPVAWEGDIGIEIHGSSSTGYPKQGYKLEARDETGEDVQTSLLDLPDGTDWVLHGPYGDKTLLRNALAYRLGAAVAEDTDEWIPRTRFFEMILNDNYRGVYLLVERVQRDGDRLDLPRLPDTEEEGDIPGGYIVKIDQHRSAGFDTRRGTPIDYVYPRYEVITEDQDAYLQDFYNEFEFMLMSDGWDDPTTGYPSWIAVDSFVDHWLVNELTHNIDAYRLSAYLYKESDADGGLLHAGPIWDFDRAFGNVNYCSCEQIDGWIIDDLTDCGAGYQFPFWWSQLLEEENFQNQLRCRWESLRGDVLSDESLKLAIAELAEEVAEVEPRDDERWNTIGTYIDPNSYVGETWEDELSWLQDWLLDRVAWMDENVPGTCGG